MFKRLIKNGFVNFFRNIWLSTAATLVMLVTLVVLTITLLVLNVSSAAIHQVQSRVDISVYFKPQASDDQISQIKQQVVAMPEVASIKYISAEEAKQIFLQRNANNPAITQALNEFDQNPLPATLQIKAKDLSQYKSIADALNNADYQQYISKVNFDDNQEVINKLARVLRTTKGVGLALVVIFCFISVLVIFNTIRLAIFSRKEEMEIMKLVGATNWYVRLPFIIESVLYALFATVIVMALTIPLYLYMVPRLNTFFGLVPGESVVSFKLIYVLIMQLGAALILGIGSSFIAIRRYLHV